MKVLTGFMCFIHTSFHDYIAGSRVIVSFLDWGVIEVKDLCKMD